MGERLVVVQQSFAEVEEVAKPFAVAEDLDQRRRASPLDQGAERIVERGLIESAAQPAQLFRRRFEACDVPRLLETREKFDLAKLDRLESAGRRELRTEGEKVLRRHRLEDLDLLDEDLLDDADAVQVVAREEDVVRVDPIPRRFELKQDDLEPQLVDLVRDDEQQLVVLGAEPVLKLEQLGHLEVCAVRELAAFFPEPPAQCLK